MSALEKTVRVPFSLVDTAALNAFSCTKVERERERGRVKEGE
jgi:hypothetical protein